MITLLTSCDQCKDDPTPISEIDKLPPATQTGRQTFGCLIDGKAWITKSYINADAYYQEGVLSITGCTVAGCLYIWIYDPVLSLKKYQLPKENIGRFSDTAGLDLYSDCD